MRLGLIAIAMTLAGCSMAAVKEAEDAVARQLRDPESAQFRDVKYFQRYVCGEVNAKNGMGGYVGFTRFIYDQENKTAKIDPGDGMGDEIAGTDRRIFNGEFDTFCKWSS